MTEEVGKNMATEYPQGARGAPTSKPGGSLRWEMASTKEGISSTGEVCGEKQECKAGQVGGEEVRGGDDLGIIEGLLLEALLLLEGMDALSLVTLQ